MNESEWFHDRRYSEITQKYPDRVIYPNYYKTHRMEFILRPGEKIFIPAGWFHFVHSEEPDPESGLCIALNFWYETKGPKVEYNKVKPKFAWHRIPCDEVIEETKHIGKLRIVKSQTNYFPPSHMKYRFPWISEECMTFDEFYDSRNSSYYITQNSNKVFDKWAPQMNSKLASSNLWINWGNCYTLIHYDGQDNWLCQLEGKRRVILFPPSDRDNLYLFNNYPVELIYDIDTKYNNDENFIRYSAKTLSDNLIKELLDVLGDQNEVFVECTDLSKSFNRELSFYNDLLRKNRSELLEVAPHMFSIKRYSKNERLKYQHDFGIIWTLTEATLIIRKDNPNLKPGDSMCYPGNWMYPVKILEDCILIKPKLV